MSESTANAKEPSMEDILASIRRIIDEEESRDGKNAGSDDSVLDRIAAVPGVSDGDDGHMPVMSAVSGTARDSDAGTTDSGVDHEVDDEDGETIFPERESLFWSRATGRNVPVPPYIKPAGHDAGETGKEVSEESDASGEGDIFARARNKLDSNSRLSPRERMQALAARAESRSEDAAEVQEAAADAVDDPDMSNVEIFNRADAPDPNAPDPNAPDPNAYDSNAPDFDDADIRATASDAVEDEKEILELTSALDEIEIGADDDFVSAASDAMPDLPDSHDLPDSPDLPDSFDDRSFDAGFSDTDTDDNDDADRDDKPGVVAGIAAAAAGGFGLNALRDKSAGTSEVVDDAEDDYRDVFDGGGNAMDDAAESAASTTQSVISDAEQASEEVFDLTDRLDSDTVKGASAMPDTVDEIAGATARTTGAAVDDVTDTVTGSGADKVADARDASEDIADTLSPQNGLYGRGDDDIPDTRDDAEVVDVTDMKIDTPDVSAWDGGSDAGNTDAASLRDDLHGEDAADDQDDTRGMQAQAADADQETAEQDGSGFPDPYGASDVYHDDPPALDDDYSASFTENAESATTYAAAGAAAAGVAGAAMASGASADDGDDLQAVGGMVRDAMEREPFDYAEPEPSALVSMTSEEISARALASLSDPESDASRRVYGALRLTDEKGSQSLEGMMREMLQPMLREWLDDNLPNVVEGIVRGEVERISSKSHRYKSDPKD